MKKKIGVFLLALCMCLGLMPPDVTVWAASGKTSVSVSAGSVNIGDTVTVQGKASWPVREKALATMMLLVGCRYFGICELFRRFERRRWKQAGQRRQLYDHPESEGCRNKRHLSVRDRRRAV